MALTATWDPVSRNAIKHASLADELADEILLSNDKTVAIIDGSGVLADPLGLNREELRRLAKIRSTVANFDLSKLSKDGYLVLVEEHDVKLPCSSLSSRIAFPDG